MKQLVSILYIGLNTYRKDSFQTHFFFFNMFINLMRKRINKVGTSLLLLLVVFFYINVTTKLVNYQIELLSAKHLRCIHL